MNKNNLYISGSDIGAITISNRRAKQIRASNCCNKVIVNPITEQPTPTLKYTFYHRKNDLVTFTNGVDISTSGGLNDSGQTIIQKTELYSDLSYNITRGSAVHDITIIQLGNNAYGLEHIFYDIDGSGNFIETTISFISSSNTTLFNQGVYMTPIYAGTGIFIGVEGYIKIIVDINLNRKIEIYTI